MILSRIASSLRLPRQILLAGMGLCLLSAGLLWPSAPLQAQTTQTAIEPAPATTGPVRLRQPAQPAPPSGNASERTGSKSPSRPASYRQSEFEIYVNRLVDPDAISRFGSELVMASTEEAEAQDFNPLVPPDYLLQPGDEIALTLWGSVDADLHLTLDRSGRVTVPRVGAIMLSGVRYADLRDVISRRVGQVFKNFQISVSLGQLRGVRVYVTGFVARPGSINVSSLATVTQVLLRAGGPSAAGSLRAIQLRRDREVVANLDLYDLLLKGDRSGDRLVQAEDVIHVGPVGTQVALIGSVNRQAIFELKPNETVADLLRMAGGFSAVADRKRLSVERLDERNTVRVSELTMPDGGGSRLATGDVVRALSAVELALPSQQKNKRVRVEGEVQQPGEYVLAADGTISTAIRAAGGLTRSAYVFGTEFNRNSVRATQQENYERALRDLETDMTRHSSTQRTSSADEASAQGVRIANAARLVDRLRGLKPSGRIILEVQPEADQLPDLLIEDGDRLFIPPKSSTVGVFGSVFNAGSYLFTDGRVLDDYLRLAGGPTKGADLGSALVVRANGSVVSGRQRAQQGWFKSNNGLTGATALPGDTVFVPEEIDKTNFVQNAKDWTTIFYNFGIGAAAIKSIFN